MVNEQVKLKVDSTHKTLLEFILQHKLFNMEH